MQKIQLSKQKIRELREEFRRLEADLLRQNETESVRMQESFRDAAAFDVSIKAQEARVQELKAILQKATILPEVTESNTVVIGSCVELDDGDGNISKYRLVHPIETDPTKGLLSIESPLGKKLLGKKQSDNMQFNKKKLTLNIVR